jgi:hypothetical protein
MYSLHKVGRSVVSGTEWLQRKPTGKFVRCTIGLAKSNPGVDAFISVGFKAKPKGLKKCGMQKK